MMVQGRRKHTVTAAVGLPVDIVSIRTVEQVGIMWRDESFHAVGRDLADRLVEQCEGVVVVLTNYGFEIVRAIGDLAAFLTAARGGLAVHCEWWLVLA